MASRMSEYFDNRTEDVLAVSGLGISDLFSKQCISAFIFILGWFFCVLLFLFVLSGLGLLLVVYFLPGSLYLHIHRHELVLNSVQKMLFAEFGHSFVYT